ncbi:MULTISPECIES: substrate-binding domain-containing protein [Bacteria]
MTIEYTRATIADVAAAAGVSRTTVSVALSGRGRVDERTRERVKTIADALNYRPSVRAQRLRGGTSRTVGLITALSNEVVGGDSHLSFLFALAMPLARILLERGYSTLLLPPVRDGDELDAIDADAVVVIDPRENDPLVASFRARGMQVVAIGDVPGVDVNGVVERGYAEAEVAIDHLVERGARNIAVLSTIEQHSLAATLRRFVRDRAGAVDARLRLVEVSTQSGEERAYRRTTELLAEEPLLDAVYAPIDVFAVGAVRAVLDAGKRIPEDVMIMTNFDGPRAQSAAPSLTALELNLTAIAEAAAQLLIACLSQPQSERRIALAPRPGLRERESTGGFRAIYSRP